MFYDPVSNVSIAILMNQSKGPNDFLLTEELIKELLFEVFNEI